jgi:hypothetical protein
VTKRLQEFAFMRQAMNRIVSLRLGLTWDDTLSTLGASLPERYKFALVQER